MRHGRRIRLGRMRLKNQGELISVKERNAEYDRLEDDGWRISELSSTIIARRGADVHILLESGFRLDTRSRESDIWLAAAAYRKALPQATSDLKQLVATLGSHWCDSPADMAVAVRRFETFLSGWRANTGGVWPDGWEPLLAECHRLAAMRRTEIEERRSRTTLMQSLVSLIVALAAFLASLIPLNWLNWMYFVTVVVVITLVILLYIEQWRALSGRRLIADNLGQCFHRFTGYVRRAIRKMHRQR